MQLATFYDHMKDMAREEKIGLTEACTSLLTSIKVSHAILKGMLECR